MPFFTSEYQVSFSLHEGKGPIGALVNEYEFTSPVFNARVGPRYMVVIDDDLIVNLSPNRGARTVLVHGVGVVVVGVVVVVVVVGTGGFS